jgi:sec-independent protein translocase protein TatA
MTNIPVTPQLAFIESPMQLLLIFGIMFVLFGAKKMPTMARDLGKGIREFKKSMSGEVDAEDMDGKEESTTCVECGTKLKSGTKFCTDCGQPIEKKVENQAEKKAMNKDKRNAKKKEVRQPKTREKDS